MNNIWIDKEEVIAALRLVIAGISESEKIKEAVFNIETNYIKDYSNGVWESKIATNWFDLKIHINYKTKND